MDVVIHNREVPKLKIELCFGFFDEIKKHLLDFRVFQDHRVIIDFGSDVIGGLVL
jgi:hypothetical protein